VKQLNASMREKAIHSLTSCADNMKGLEVIETNEVPLCHAPDCP